MCEKPSPLKGSVTFQRSPAELAVSERDCIWWDLCVWYGVSVAVWRRRLEVVTPVTLSDLSFVSSHPGSLTIHPHVPSAPPTMGPPGWEGGGGVQLFYDFFAIFLFLHPIRFSVPVSSSGVGGHHLYRCLGIKVPWPLLLRGGLWQRWLGQGASGRGGLPFVPASRVGFSSHRTWGLRGGPSPRCMTAMR